MATKALPILITVREASNLLDLPRSKVYLLIELKAIHAVKVGANWRIKSESLKPLLPAGEPPAKPPVESTDGTTAL